jgi:hypothetical protein
MSGQGMYGAGVLRGWVVPRDSDDVLMSLRSQLGGQSGGDHAQEWKKSSQTQGLLEEEVAARRSRWVALPLTQPGGERGWEEGEGGGGAEGSVEQQQAQAVSRGHERQQQVCLPALLCAQARLSADEGLDVHVVICAVCVPARQVSNSPWQSAVLVYGLARLQPDLRSS